MKLTPGKLKGLKAVSNSRDVIAAAAMDQRGSLKSAIAKDKGIDKGAVTAQMLEEFKTAVVKILTPHASAILLDPEYGLRPLWCDRRTLASCSPMKTAVTTTRVPAAFPIFWTFGLSAVW